MWNTIKINDKKSLWYNVNSKEGRLLFTIFEKCKSHENSSSIAGTYTLHMQIEDLYKCKFVLTHDFFDINEEFEIKESIIVDVIAYIIKRESSMEG